MATDGAEILWLRGNDQGEARTLIGEQHVWDGPVQAGTSQPLKLSKGKIALAIARRTGGELEDGEFVGYLPTSPQ